MSGYHHERKKLLYCESDYDCVQCMHTGKVFQKRKEDFVCEHCGTRVAGDGYTNHCPHCLFSKHVDVFPGDRLEDCGGLMEPIGYEQEKNQKRLVYRCLRCGKEGKNKVQEMDDFEVILTVARRQATTM